MDLSQCDHDEAGNVIDPITTEIISKDRLITITFGNKNYCYDIDTINTIVNNHIDKNPGSSMYDTLDPYTHIKFPEEVIDKVLDYSLPLLRVLKITEEISGEKLINVKQISLIRTFGEILLSLLDEKLTELTTKDYYLDNMSLYDMDLNTKIIDIPQIDVDKNIITVTKISTDDERENQLGRIWYNYFREHNLPTDLFDIYSIYYKVDSLQLLQEAETKNRLNDVKIVKLNNMNLNEIPSQIFKMTNLYSLDLSSNNIIEISDDISNLVSLHTLLISNNKLKILDLSNIDSITNIHADHNNIEIIILDKTRLFPKYRELILSHNNLKEFPILTRGVWELNLSYNQFNQPLKIDTFHKIDILDESFNPFSFCLTFEELMV